MSYISNIKDFSEDLSVFNDEIIYSNIPINNCEKYINAILDTHSDICKYYINCVESCWSVSFNVNIEQYDAMVQTTFEIKLFKNIKNDNGIIILTKEIGQHDQWNNIHGDLRKKLNKN